MRNPEDRDTPGDETRSASQEDTRQRLHTELAAILRSTGMRPDDACEAAAGLSSETEQVLQVAGDHAAVSVMLSGLRDLLDGLGLRSGTVAFAEPAFVLNNPAAALSQVGAKRIAESLGEEWDRTCVRDRPLLVARRVLRRAVDPEAAGDAL